MSVPEGLVALRLINRARHVGRGLRARVKAKRVILPHDLHVVSIGVEDLLHRRPYALAEGALKLREFHNGNERFFSALFGVVIVNGNGPNGGVRWRCISLLLLTGVSLSLGVLGDEDRVNLFRLGS